MSARPSGGGATGAGVLRAACVQLNPRGDVSENLRVALELVEAAADQGAGLVALPETWLFKGRRDGIMATAEPPDGPANAALGRVGIIMALEVSRLTRGSAAWYHLLDICAITATLIGDAGSCPGGTTLRTSSVSGMLLVYIVDSAGTNIKCSFHFVSYAGQ